MFHWSRVYDLIATWFPRKPVAYLCLFVGWATTLWFLSAGNPAPKNGPEIPHVDKVAHFGYFFIGGALLSTWGLIRWPRFQKRRLALFLVVAAVTTVIGRLDEYHQSFTPGRSGNDTGDWIADIVGGIAGSIFVLAVVFPGVRGRGGEQNKLRNSQIVPNSLD